MAALRAGGRVPAESWIWMDRGVADTLAVQRYRSPGALYLAAAAYGPEYDALPGIYLSLTTDRPDLSPQRVVPRGVRSVVLPWLAAGREWPRGTHAEGTAIDARGWPRACLFHVCNEAEVGRGPRGYLEVPGPWRCGVADGFFYRVGPRPVRLPLLPLWGNLALDGLFYSAAWGTVLMAPRSLRRALRRRRARCVRCAYDLQGLPAGAVCPECGLEPSGRAGRMGGR